MKRKYKYLAGLLPGTLVIAGNLAGGWWVASNTVFSLVILAVAERFVPENKDNSTEEDIFFPNLVLFLHIMVQCACMVTLIYSLFIHTFHVGQLIVLSISVGTNSGASAIVIAHELIHRKNKWVQLAGKFLLFTAGNIYFYVDHLRVHHKWVGTTKDPATALYGESVYRFFVRSAYGQIRSSYLLEKKRLHDQPAVTSFFFNYVISSFLLLLVFTIGLAVFVNIKCAAVFVLQSVVANFLLEYTNYIEHYGLTRKDHERVIETHSWQSDKVISRYFLIDLSRHADHHYYASKPYHRLDSYENSPVLPGGYVEMIYYALIPPMWFKKVHRALEKYKHPAVAAG